MNEQKKSNDKNKDYRILVMGFDRDVKMYVLSKEEMTGIDKHTIEKIGIDAGILMEHAGYNAAQFIAGQVEEEAKIGIFSGHGNNGGDGFVIARCLKNLGFESVVFFVGNRERMSQETTANFELLEKLGIGIIPISSTKEWEEIAAVQFCEEKPGFRGLIDALFGIGFKGELPELQAKILTTLNTLPGKKFAVDICSGLNANTGQTEKAFKADYTLTMAAPKYGHFLGKGREYSGRVIAIDIGIPQNVWQDKCPAVNLITADNISYPYRNRFYHKGDYGRVAIIAGSPGFSGAAVLAAKAALRAGSGLITLFHHQGMEAIYETNLVEIMTKTLPFSEEEIMHSGYAAEDRIRTVPGIKELLSALELYDVLLIGPGLGVNPLSTALVNIVTMEWEKPALFDADALNILAHYPHWLQRCEKKPFVLTPHIGEFARMTHVSIQEVLQDPVGAVKQFLSEYDCHLLLKGITRIFANRSGMFFDISGNDGLATGGSGDVLAGIIVSFLGQKLLPSEAATAGSYLLGTTAESCSLLKKTAAVTPSDIIANLFLKDE